tara:strand:+ start:302 stop:712 length:411 start_codon:yes stop_codon:yes gene_type:complete
MAYVSQELKAKLAPAIKAVCKKYGVSATVAVRNHSTLVLNIKSGKIDFLESANRLRQIDWAWKRPTWKFTPENNLQVNPYHYKDHFDGKALRFLSEVMPLMSIGNHDNSDIMTDYFDVGWYVDVNIGQWNKPYVLE